METIGYFSAENAAVPGAPNYAGGLGVLSGDTVRAVGDLDYHACPYNFVAVSLLYPEGYFRQSIFNGEQNEDYPTWSPDSMGLHLEQAKIRVNMAGRDVEVGCWRFDYAGRKRVVPVYFLDTGRVSGCDNELDDCRITARVYSGDNWNRIRQLAVLGIGGLRMLEALGHGVTTYHANEGHAAFMIPELLGRMPLEDVRQRVVYTTHSRVAGHDGFDYELVNSVFNGAMPHNIGDFAGHDYLSMTRLALRGSRAANAVSRAHSETFRRDESFRRDFGGDIGYVTNGVHHTIWTSEPFQKLFDDELQGWRDRPSLLGKVCRINGTKIKNARGKAKRAAVEALNDEYNAGLDAERPVIGWARRFDGSYYDGRGWSSYKRPMLLFSDMDRLSALIKKHDGQLIYAGKAHPNNGHAKREIMEVNRCLEELRRSGISAHFFADYNMHRCGLITTASDIWLNTPRIPLEASGTSGMCAALNGVPHASTVDGWWVEGFSGRNGWVIGGMQSDDWKDAQSLYSILDEGLGSTGSMTAGAIETGAFFNTHRMVREYADKLYRQ